MDAANPPVITTRSNSHSSLATVRKVDGDQNAQNTYSHIARCSSLKQLKQVHAQMLRTSLSFDPYSASKLISSASLSPFSSLAYALKVFDQIPQPNLYTWNILIRADPARSILVFLRMLHETSYFAGKFTFPFVLKAAASMSDLRIGKSFHGMIVKASLASDIFVLNSLVHVYGSCGELGLTHRVFKSNPRKDAVSWNSMINAGVQVGCFDEALEMFKSMENENIMPNDVTMMGLLSASAKKLDLELGRWLCSYIETSGTDMNLILSNAILDMFMKCGSAEDAQGVFDKMIEKDVSWTTMLDGYAKLGNYDEARWVFDCVPRKDIAAWNALIFAYEQNGKAKEALECFHELQCSNRVVPDEITIVSTLSACAQLGVICDIPRV